MCLGRSSKAPDPPPPPVVPRSATAASRAAVTEQRETAARRTGQSASIMTSPLGLENRARTEKNQLLSGAQ